MAGLGAPELLIVLAIGMLLFGSAKLPKLARSLGEAQRELRSGMKDGDRAATVAPPAPDLPPVA